MSFLYSVNPFTTLDAGKHTVKVIKIPYSHTIQLQKRYHTFAIDIRKIFRKYYVIKVRFLLEHTKVTVA